MSNPLAKQAVRGAIRELDDEEDPEAAAYSEDDGYDPERDDPDYQPAALPAHQQTSADPYSQQLAHMRNLLQYEANPQVRNQLELNIQDLMRARMRAGIR